MMRLVSSDAATVATLDLFPRGSAALDERARADAEADNQLLLSERLKAAFIMHDEHVKAHAEGDAA